MLAASVVLVFAVIFDYGADVQPAAVNAVNFLIEPDSMSFWS